MARDLAVAGAPEGLVVLAEEQTAGRGRRGRRWVAPAGSSLLFTVLLRPLLSPDRSQWLTMLCSLAVAESIESHMGLATGLKWPNDLLIDGRKVGGVLTELGIEGERLDYAVVGVGLNVNLDTRDPQFDPFRDSATSLSAQLHEPVAREPLLASVLQRLETRYLALRDGWSPCEEWAARLTMLGREVVVSGLPGTVAGRAEGVDWDGALLLRLGDGATARILAGDVSLRPLADRAGGSSSGDSLAP